MNEESIIFNMDNEPTITIPVSALRLIDFHGYMERVTELFQENQDRTVQDVYEIVEGEFERYFQRRRYVDYQSFRQARYYYTRAVLNRDIK